MDLTKIVSISGKSGLFKVISQSKNAVIVESLTDQKRFPAFGHEKMSSLGEISVFTTDEDRPLKDVFKSIYEKLEGKATIDPKSDNPVLLNFFGEMVPDFDKERVYVSDIRKMLSWYNMLLAQNLLDFTEPAEEKPATEEKPTEEPVIIEKPAEESLSEEKPTEKPAAEVKATAKPVSGEKPAKKPAAKEKPAAVKPEKKTVHKKKTE